MILHFPTIPVSHAEIMLKIKRKQMTAKKKIVSNNALVTPTLSVKRSGKFNKSKGKDNNEATLFIADKSWYFLISIAAVCVYM